MILSVSRYVIQKEEQRKLQEQQAADEQLQIAAQALVTQARELVNMEEENEDNI